MNVNELERAETNGRKASHRHKTITDALTAIGEIVPEEREQFLCGFYTERAVMHALAIRVLIDAKSVPLEQIVKASVELSEIAARLEQVATSGTVS